jgi:hypothetical protein
VDDRGRLRRGLSGPRPLARIHLPRAGRLGSIRAIRSPRYNRASCSLSWRWTSAGSIAPMSTT